jgi:hypothetical protein
MRLVAVWLLAASIVGLFGCDDGEGGFGFRNLGKRAASTLQDARGTPQR